MTIFRDRVGCASASVQNFPSSINKELLNRLSDVLDAMPDEQKRLQANPLMPGSDGRLAVRIQGSRLRFAHPSGGSGEREAFVRTLGPGAASVIVSGMLHTGTRVRVKVPSAWRAAVEVDGEVKSCRHVQSTLHELEVRFIEPLDLSQVVQDEQIRRFRGELPVEATRVAASLLVTGLEELEFELVRAHLRGTEVDLVVAETPGKALDHLQRADPDVMAIRWSEEGPGSDLLDKARTAGFDGSVVLMVSNLTTAQVHEVEEGLQAIVLTMPFERGDLYEAIRRAAEAAAGRRKLPLTSTLGASAAEREIAGRYIEACRIRSGRWQGCTASGDNTAVVGDLAWIRDTAGSFGFKALGDLAKSAHAAMTTGQPGEWLAPMRRTRLYIERLSHAMGNPTTSPSPTAASAAA